MAADEVFLSNIEGPANILQKVSGISWEFFLKRKRIHEFIDIVFVIGGPSIHVYHVQKNKRPNSK